MKDLVKKIISQSILSFYHFLLAFLGALIYRFPSRKLKVIGVTGTNGKSTVVEMVSKILEDYNPPTTLPLASGERAPAEYKVASISSIKFKIGDKEWLNTLKMTMPGRFKIQKFLRQAAKANCQYLVLEVTSEGIKQHRHQFIDFAVAVFTNLTPEHIEAHGGFERYREAKGKLFKATKDIHIINLDDENAEYFLRFPAHKKIGFTLNEMSREPFSAIKAKNIQVLQSGLKFFVDDTEFNLKLLGEFNIYNALAAICVGLSQEISLETCKKALEKIEGIPGRMEEVIPKPFKVFVDYAFTPNALEKVYQTIKYNFKPKKLICVLGATGGGRDKWKRPILGKLTREYCDEVIVTNEDPYNEDPMEIINQVADGAGEKAKKILDRRRAISEALKIAKEGDVIIITGKGCEPWICVTGGKKIPWDDRQVVKEEFRKIHEKIRNFRT